MKCIKLTDWKISVESRGGTKNVIKHAKIEKLRDCFTILQLPKTLLISNRLGHKAEEYVDVQREGVWRGCIFCINFYTDEAKVQNKVNKLKRPGVAPPTLSKYQR